MVRKRTGLFITCIVFGLSLLAAGALVSQADVVPSGLPAARNVAVLPGNVDGEPGTRTAVLGEVGAIGASGVLTPVAYLPIVPKQYFTAFGYADDFEDVGSGWPWGTSPFDYGYRTDSDSSNVYHIRVEDEGDIAFITGPADAYVAGNFEFKAHMRRGRDNPKYWGDEYGILLSPQPIDPQNPVGSGAYTFHMELRIDNTEDSYYSIAKWNALNRNNRSVLVRTEEGDDISDAEKVWNVFKITRIGDTLNFYVTRQDGGGWTAWQHVHSLTDSALDDQLYVGFYAYHSKDDFGDYSIEFQFDNLSAHSSP